MGGDSMSFPGNTRRCDLCGVDVSVGRLFFVDGPTVAGESTAHMVVCRACYLRAEQAVGNDYRSGWKIGWLLKRWIDARPKISDFPDFAYARRTYALSRDPGG